ncbi:protein FAR1-RELATED SEQUENCE 5-like [Arachis hypogaea]|uniref:protein FAR1-RELATED SEQUENCE 5-like n=1 Tax=Arachis hypogaea TaxID=3818 RepID=UPI000DECF99F|nr:protein FAR1-RELATED SEQUENCE 5-like [Arachis hypogaea]
MDFDLYSSDNDEESSEMSLGVCGSSGSSDDDDSTSLFGMGTIFTSEEEAYNAYKGFAWTRGFGVCKGDVGRVDGVLVRRDIFCHRQGTRSDKHYDRPERVREERLESRTNCKAKLKIYYDVHDNVWRVRKIIDEHNHNMAPTAVCNLLPSHRKMSDGDKAQVNSMKQFKIPTPKIMAYMAGQSGGYNMLRFTKRDLYNYDEEVRTYRWVLLNLLDVMGQRTPNLVVTDGKKAMRAAIAEVMPSAMHRLCAWHLEKNCVQRVKEAKFWKVFKKVIYANFDFDDLDRVVKDYQNNEVTAQFYSIYYTPVLNTGLDAIELSTSKLYTRAVFREVKKQIKGVATLLFQGRESISMTIVYSFSKMGRPDRVFKVLYDPNDRKIECECKMSDSYVIPCSHIFCVMKYEGMEEIPETLVLRRWCKIAKDCTTLKMENDSREQARLLRYNALYSTLSHVVTLGCKEVEDFALAQDAISNLVDILQQRCVKKDGNKVLPNNCAVKDPTMAATKGAPKREKTNLCASEEEPKPKRHCCTKCGVPGHTRRLCASHDAKAIPTGSKAPSSAFAESSFANEPKVTSSVANKVHH